MRIFIAVRHSNNPALFYGDLWSKNFYPALRALSHELVESQTDLLATSRFMSVDPDDFTPEQRETRARTTQAIIDEVKAAHAQKPIDVFLSYFYNTHFDPAGFDEIHRLGIPTINYYCNNIHQFQLVDRIAPKVNFSWYAEKDARADYQRVGANPIWVQMGADPQMYHPVAVEKREANAFFVGQRYADRERWMAALVEAGVPCVLYGAGWKRQQDSPGVVAKSAAEPAPGPAPSKLQQDLGEVKRNMRSNGFFGGLMRSWRQYQYRQETKRILPLLEPIARGFVPGGDLCRVFSSHEVALNFSAVWKDSRPGSPLVSHVRLRDFEGPMCRACYITEYTDELAEFYVPGKEVETYKTSAELIDKTRFLLANPDVAECLREAGYRRALRDHTWVKRFEQLFALTGLAR